MLQLARAYEKALHRRMQQHVASAAKHAEPRANAEQQRRTLRLATRVHPAPEAQDCGAAGEVAVPAGSAVHVVGTAGAASGGAADADISTAAVQMQRLVRALQTDHVLLRHLRQCGDGIVEARALAEALCINVTFDHGTPEIQVRDAAQRVLACSHPAALQASGQLRSQRGPHAAAASCAQFAVVELLSSGVSQVEWCSVSQKARAWSSTAWSSSRGCMPLELCRHCCTC